MDFLERLDALMFARGLNKHTLSEQSGVPYTTIMGWYAKGYERAKIPSLRKLSDFFGCSLDYIVGDSDDPKPRDWTIPIENPRTHHTHAETPAIAAAYDKASDKDRLTVRTVLDVAEGKTLRIVTPRDVEIAAELVPELVLFPQADYEACAGMGNYLMEADRFTLCEFPRDSIPPRASFAVTIKGDSMQPKFYSGDTVFVQGMPRIDIGDYGIFIVNGEAMCKRLVSDGQGHPYLHSLNPEYPDIYIDENTDVVTCGRIIGHR